MAQEKNLRLSCKIPLQNYKRLRKRSAKKNRSVEIKRQGLRCRLVLQESDEFPGKAMKQVDGTVSGATPWWSKQPIRSQGRFLLSSSPKVWTFSSLNPSSRPIDRSTNLQLVHFGRKNGRSLHFTGCFWQSHLRRTLSSNCDFLFFFFFLHRAHLIINHIHNIHNNLGIKKKKHP